MLKEIKKEKDVITNQDLFNEIIKKVKKSDKWPSSIMMFHFTCGLMEQVMLIGFTN